MTRKSEPRGRRRCLPRVIGLGRATGHNRYGTCINRGAEQEFELANLVAAAAESGASSRLTSSVWSPMAEPSRSSRSNGVGRWPRRMRGNLSNGRMLDSLRIGSLSRRPNARPDTNPDHHDDDVVSCASQPRALDAQRLSPDCHRSSCCTSVGHPPWFGPRTSARSPTHYNCGSCGSPHDR